MFMFVITVGRVNLEQVGFLVWIVLGMNFVNCCSYAELLIIYLIFPYFIAVSYVSCEAWNLKKRERNSWICDPEWGVICLVKYTWPVNFFFHFVKTSRFPRNLVRKRRDLNFSLYAWHVIFSKIRPWNRIRTTSVCYHPKTRVSLSLQNRRNLGERVLSI